MTRVVGASFNIYKKLSEIDRLDDFNDLLVIDEISVAGLQEIVWEVEAQLHNTLWQVHQPGGNAARKDPIIWKGHKAIARGHILLHEPVEHGGKKAPARYAAWVVFEDFIWVNFHLNADVEQPAGHPKEGSPRPRSNFVMIRKVIGLCDTLQVEYNLPVFISADMNVDFEADRRVKHRFFPYVNLKKAGFKPCWEGRKVESTRRKKPIRGRSIDQVWARGSKTHRVVFLNCWTPNRWSKGDPVESDHLAVIVVAKIKKRIFPWLFNRRGQRK